MVVEVGRAAVEADRMVVEAGCMAVEAGCVAVEAGRVAVEAGCMVVEAGCMGRHEATTEKSPGLFFSTPSNPQPPSKNDIELKEKRVDAEKDAQSGGNRHKGA